MVDTNKVERVLLVLIGALGDLAWRKFLEDARRLERRRSDVSILLVDVGWTGEPPIPLEEELRWRIGCRLIELRAEQIYDDGLDPRKNPSIRLKKDSPLETKPLRWDVHGFVSDNLEGDSEGLETERSRLDQKLGEWLQWFIESSSAGLRRYWHGGEVPAASLQQLKAEGWKIAVFVATPPQAYPSIAKSWDGLADSILLEKPAAGLNPGNLSYAGTSQLLDAVNAARSRISTNDHYNSKLVTRSMDRIRDYKLLDHLLEPSRIQRIVVELLERAPLPLGRCNFYNGAGGAFGDMVPHLLQAVRAILGLDIATLSDVFDDTRTDESHLKFYWARYEGAPLDPIATPDGVPYSCNPGYYQPLNLKTETFVAFKTFVRLNECNVPLFCRTGKGFSPERKTLRLDTRYDDAGSTLSISFDFGSATLNLRDDANNFVLATGNLSLEEGFRPGVPRVVMYKDEAVGNVVKIVEYESILECLANTWEPHFLDPRYFPPVEDAARLADIVFDRLEKERQSRIKVYSYTVRESDTCQEVLGFLDDCAHWN